MSQLPTAEYILGLDLSGPSNIKDTALAVFKDQADRLSLISVKTGVSDPEIFVLANSLAEEGRVRFGLDAPLSYNPGGGDRPGDKNLRRLLIEAGLPGGCVLTPTMTRMAYLTLRGMSLARGLGHVIRPAPQIAEVHPGGALLLRGAPLNAVRTLKKDPRARNDLWNWLANQGLEGISQLETGDDHTIMACAAALATWKWKQDRPAWIQPASPPYHPYDYVC